MSDDIQSYYRSASSSPAKNSPALTSLLSDPILVASAALMISYGYHLLNTSLPPAILNPAWQLRVASTLVHTAYLPLLALVLIRINREAAICRITASQQRSLRKSLASWAVIASLGFVLLLPLQAAAAWNLIRQDFRPLDGGKGAMETPLKNMEKAIREAPDANTLQEQLTILRGPVIAPKDLRRPLPELKKLLLASLDQAQNNLRTTSKRQTTLRIWQLVQDCLLTSVASLAYAAGFAAFAQRPGQPQTLLQELASAGRADRPMGLRRRIP